MHKEKHSRPNLLQGKQDQVKIQVIEYAGASTGEDTGEDAGCTGKGAGECADAGAGCHPLEELSMTHL